MEITVGTKFATFADAKSAIEDFCSRKFHPIRIDKRESVGKYNDRIGESFRIQNLKRDDVFSCRYALPR